VPRSEFYCCARTAYTLLCLWMHHSAAMDCSQQYCSTTISLFHNRIAVQRPHTSSPPPHGATTITTRPTVDQTRSTNARKPPVHLVVCLGWILAQLQTVEYPLRSHHPQTQRDCVQHFHGAAFIAKLQERGDSEGTDAAGVTQ
jgi:hypothetical protein